MMRDARMRSAFPARSPGTLAPVFTAEQRNALRDRLLWLAEQDERVVAAAAVGSLAVDAGDRFSDLDLTFGIEDGTPVAHVLDDWTRTLVGDLDAVHLADLERDPTTYRVFLLPDALQVDLSMTPAARFRPAGPRFRLLFGDTAPGDAITVRPPDAGDLFGWGVVYAVHARACIERGRLWQAEHYVGATRDHALALACLRHGLTAVQARATTTCPRRPSPASTTPTSPPSSRRLSAGPSRPPSARSSTRAARRDFRRRTPSRDAWPTSAAECAGVPTAVHVGDVMTVAGHDERNVLQTALAPHAPVVGTAGEEEDASAVHPPALPRRPGLRRRPSRRTPTPCRRPRARGARGRCCGA